uniref:Calponin-2 n=1 Tax=Colobus angolensis palliatus TaxID=336983 RepID=A0A2K5HPX1_COLAP
SSTQFSKGPSSYGLLAEVKNWLLSKYDPQKEGLTGLSISPDFQKAGRTDGMILCTLMNKLQPGSVPKLNHSMQNWHQLENLSSFIKTMVSYGMNPVDLFELQVSLLAMAGKMGTNKCASQSGMTAYSTRSVQMGTNKCVSQVCMMAPGTRRHIYDPKLGNDKCENSSMSLQKGYTQALGLGQQIYDPKYCPQGTVADGAPSGAGDCLGPGEVPEYPPYYQEEAGY